MKKTDIKKEVELLKSRLITNRRSKKVLLSSCLSDSEEDCEPEGPPERGISAILEEEDLQNLKEDITARKENNHSMQSCENELTVI